MVPSALFSLRLAQKPVPIIHRLVSWCCTTCFFESYRRVGYGHVYQSRFKSFPVETNEYFFQVLRYVERNALRANLVKRAEDWPFGSLWIHHERSAEDRAL